MGSTAVVSDAEFGVFFGTIHVCISRVLSASTSTPSIADSRLPDRLTELAALLVVGASSHSAPRQFRSLER